MHRQMRHTIRQVISMLVLAIRGNLTVSLAAHLPPLTPMRVGAVEGLAQWAQMQRARARRVLVDQEEITRIAQVPLFCMRQEVAEVAGREQQERRADRARARADRGTQMAAVPRQTRDQAAAAWGATPHPILLVLVGVASWSCAI